MMQNPYIPMPVEISKIIEEVNTKDIKTFRLRFINHHDEDNFQYLPGQFAELSIFGKGESPIGISSTPTQKGYIEFTVQKAGVVTSALHDMETGSLIGIRGPLGNSWPIDYLEGKNIVIVGGGFAFSTLRSLLNYLIDEENRKRFGKITVFSAARNPGLLIYKDELEAWGKRPDVDLNVTVDKGDTNWKGKEGLITTLCEEVAPSCKNTVVIICGPPVMIRFTLQVFLKLGFSTENIFTSREARMKCGIGKCGRCNIGSKYICKDGPVFSQAELDRLPKED
jgi:NAD(P)H-flavin reductase